MKNRLLYIIISLVLVLGIVFLVSRITAKKSAEDFFGVSATDNSSTPSSQASLGESAVVYNNVSTHTYKNAAYKFSIDVPKDITPSDFDESNGHNVLVQDKTFQMQIYITQFDEDITLTKERIQKDVPDLQMENVNSVTINGVTGVAFISNDNGQKYRQVWVVRKGYLYQTLSPANEDAMTSNILQSWKWF